MSETWDKEAKTWDQRETARIYSDQAFASLIKHVDVRDGPWRSKRVLDFGCGTGLLAEKLAPLVREVVATDTSPAMIDALSSKAIGNVKAICTDIIGDGPHRDETWFGNFDLIVASSVCSFLPNYDGSVEVLARVLSPTGYFVQWDWLSTDDDGFGLTLDRVSDAFDKAGLRCVSVERAFDVAVDDGKMAVLIGVARAD